MTEFSQSDPGSGTTYLQIDFPPATAHPSRIFRAMAELIDAFEAIDRDLLHTLDPQSEPVFILERIEAGSLRVFIAILRFFPDDALLNLDPRPLLGQFLVKAKQALLKWLGGKDTIRHPSDVLELQNVLDDVRRRTIGGDGRVPLDRLLDDLRRLSSATAILEVQDRVIYVADGETIMINTRFQVVVDDTRGAMDRSVGSAVASNPAIPVPRPPRNPVLRIVGWALAIAVIVAVVAIVAFAWRFKIPAP
jgi:hypothetical protein